ncbi:synaptic vesicle glycoprotein 2C-like [Chironomus tepperi]|uniref:synaptic vesicle glycoprotein 2C-like n=1 Tax=Chironomus tepperi TaxID=113505 RepID=UPI00391F3BA0
MKTDEEENRNSGFKEFHTYNQALELTGLGKFHYFLLLTCGLCLMSVIVETLNIGFIIPLIDFECVLKLTLADKGILSASAFAGVVSSSYFWGFFADVTGRHKVMLICSMCTFIFSFLSSFSINVWMLIVTRFLVGFFVSGLAANTYAYLGEFHCDKTRAKHLNFCGVFMALALTFCPAMGWMILKFRHPESSFIHLEFIGVHYSFWRLFFVICSVLPFFMSMFLWFLPESPKFLLLQKKHDQVVKILHTIYRSNTRSHMYPVSNIEIDEQLLGSQREGKNFLKQLWIQTVPLFKAPYHISTIKLSFVMFCLFAASSGFFLWTPDILNQMIEYPNNTVCEIVDFVIGKRQNSTANTCSSSVSINEGIYEITFMMGLFFSIVYFFNGLVINKFGKKNLLALWFILSGLSSIQVPFNKNYYVILFLLLIFLTCGCCGSITSACIVDIYPTNIRAISLCIILIIGRIGAIVGSVFVSFMIATSCTAMFQIFGGMLIISAIISCVLPD